MMRSLQQICSERFAMCTIGLMDCSSSTSREGSFGSMSTKLYGYKREQEGVFGDLLAKDVLDSFMSASANQQNCS